MDGKYVPVKEVIYQSYPGKIPRSRKRQKVKRGLVLIWGTDYGTHDIPNHTWDFSETVDAYERYFRNLKKQGYEMKSCTLDDKTEALMALLKWYPGCIIQLCIKHYLANLNRNLTTQHIRRKIKSYERKLNTFFIDPQQDYIPVSRNYSLKQAVKLTNAILELEYRYELLLEFETALILILTAKDYQTALRRVDSLERYFLPQRLKLNYPQEHIRLVKKIFKDFKRNQEYVLNYLKYPHLNIPRTTNLLEGYNSHLEMRLASIKGFEAIKNAKNYVNAWILKRRFTAFSCCREPFKHLNGKAPLECAGVDISKIKNWLTFCRKSD